MQATDDPTLKRQSDFDRLGELENRIVQLQLDSLQKSLADHEGRLRTLEDTATRFNFLVYLTMGGGLLSLVNLLTLAFIAVRAIQP